jgi:hypothetical protein
MEELVALDATREIPYLKALCNRRFIATPGPNPTPHQIIPIIEQFVATHRAKKPKTLSPYADIFVEWKLILEDLEEFLTNLRALIPSANEKCSLLNDQCSMNSSPHPKTPSTSGHSNNPTQKHTKTPAIQTNTSPTPQTLGHSNNSTQKNSPASLNETQSRLQLQSQNRPTPPRPRRNNALLATLTHDQKQHLVDLYQQNSTLDAIKLAREKLGIQISAGTLSNLATTWQIREDHDTINDLAATHSEQSAIPDPQSAILATLTEQQLQLRLLQLASRPNINHTELRAITHSFARLQSLKLSARRVQLAEAKEARLAGNDQSNDPFSAENYNEFIDKAWGPRPPRKRQFQSNSRQAG